MKLIDLTKEQLIKEVAKLKARKKYGLVWEDKPEDVVEQCKKKLPVLEEDKKKAINTDEKLPTNLIIEGDNYHALSVLNYTHQGKIDVIYIDPPYNTGAKDWKYNNDYVDINDTYRHSKWLSFMEKRLRFTEKLLSDRGVLVCTIDHNEQENLGILLREIFPDKEVTCVCIVHNPAGIQGINFSHSNEYAYFVYPKGKRYIGYQYRDDNSKDIRNFRDVTGDSSLRAAAKNCFYPILVKDGQVVGFGDVCPNDFHPKMNIKRKDGIIEIYPIDPEGTERKWRFARQTVEGVQNELIAKYLKKRDVWDIVRAKNKFNYKTVWVDPKYFANNYGTQVLNKILPPNSFSYPKSIYAVMDCIDAAGNNSKNLTVLDYFAGSGTTGHATMLLNKDGGTRKFILCTNNENGIAEDICYPRIKNVIKKIKGLESISGIPANLRYFKTSFVPKSNVSDDTRNNLVKKSTEMICVREDTFNEVLDKKEYKLYRNSGFVTAILFNLDKIDKFKDELNKLGLPAHVYVFSLTSDTYISDFEDLDIEHELCPIPESILEVYRKLFEE